MSKEFRIWDSSEKHFINNGESFDFANIVWLENNGIIDTLDSNFIFLSFTGKQDSKGIDIYEGDIIYYRHKFEHGELFEGRAEVIWDEEIAAFSFDGFTWLDSNVIWDSIKVVGNKFQ